MDSTMDTRRLFVLGPRGQVGWELMRALQPLGRVIGLDRSALDLDLPALLAERLAAQAGDVIVNAAAWTAVDAAEAHEAQAHRINGEAPGALADIAQRAGALLVHYSTDYVFDGSGTRPWQEADPCGPVNAYGRTKLAGERAIAATGADWLILRTSWVYASRGANFVKTMLRLGAERESLRIVADQIGAPTSARLIADVTAQVVRQSIVDRSAGRFESGIFHLSARGETSWHGFAQAIFDRWPALAGDSPLRVRELDPIPSSEYPTPAARPLNSRLCCDALEARFGLTLADWQTGLELVLGELAA
jgi:dTDP-4-dehydrorhamnose reductase